jgi:hypothetical protein
MRPLIIFVTAALLLTGQHPDMPPGISHEEHAKQMQKDEALKKRGAEAMGFDQDATTHHFTQTPTGGSIDVTAKSAADEKSIASIRAHLRSIAGEFARGRFDKPFQTHGEIPPGVPEMQKGAGAIAYRYEDMPRGGVVHIDTQDPRLIEAVHAFLRYQMVEHHTGARRH